MYFLWPCLSPSLPLPANSFAKLTFLMFFNFCGLENRTETSETHRNGVAVGIAVLGRPDLATVSGNGKAQLSRPLAHETQQFSYCHRSSVYSPLVQSKVGQSRCFPAFFDLLNPTDS